MTIAHVHTAFQEVRFFGELIQQLWAGGDPRPPPGSNNVGPFVCPSHTGALWAAFDRAGQLVCSRRGAGLPASPLSHPPTLFDVVAR